MQFKYLVREFIVENFLFGEEGDLNDTTNFFEKGIIDSTGILELVSFIEDSFNIVIDDDELVPHNFHNLNSIETFLLKKKNGKVVY